MDRFEAVGDCYGRAGKWHATNIHPKVFERHRFLLWPLVPWIRLLFFPPLPAETANKLVTTRSRGRLAAPAAFADF